jgi:histone-binding protein RBBP4
MNKQTLRARSTSQACSWLAADLRHCSIAFCLSLSRYTVQRLLLGTHTSAAVVDSAAAASSNGAAVAAVAPQNYLLIAEVRLPRADGSSSMANGSAANNGDVQIKGSSSDLDGGGGGSSGNGIYGRSQGRIEIVQRIPHAGEVNRARYAPFNPDLIATKSPSSVVCVFDRSKHSSRPIEMSSLGSLVGGSGSGSSGAVQARPDLLLEGHTEEGYGLQWNPHAGERGSILSGSNDGLICMWNVEQAAQERKKTGTGSSGGAISAATPTLSALRTFRAHTDVVEDVAWSHFQPSVFASCGDDARLLLWDTRTGGGTGSGSGSSGAAAGGGTQPVAALNDPTKARSAQAAANARRNVDGARSAGASHHTGNINCVGFNHFSEHVLASGGSDGVVLLWDLRSLSSPLHALRAQNEHFHASSTSGSSADGVAASAPLHFFNLQWSPFSADLLLATDATRRAYIWDVSRIGDEDEGQSNGGADDEDEESDGLPRSLTFVHGGMTDRIGDACWNANEGDEWMVASVADDNVLQIWQVSESVYGNDDDEAPAR